MDTELIPRVATRQSVLKTAKLIYRDTVINCLVTDQSSSGVRVRLSTAMLFPDQLTIRFPGGSAFDVIRRWSRGTEMGLEFTGTANWGDEARSEALSIYESMRDDRFRPLRRLQDLNYFDDPALRELAAETERAIAKLEAEVRGRTQRLS